MNRVYHIVGVGINLHTCVFNHVAMLHRAGHWGALKRRERDATSHVETLGSTQPTRRTDCPQDSESKTVCVFARIRAMNCLMKPSEARVSESVSQSRPRTSTCDSGDPGGFRSSCKRIRERPIVKQIQQILSIDQNNYTTLTSLKLGFTPIRRPGDSECLFAQVFIDLNLGVPFPTRC
jgi:hypothetical protein